MQQSLSPYSFVIVAVVVVFTTLMPTTGMAQITVGPCIGGLCPPNSTCNVATTECVQQSMPCIDLAAPGQLSDCPKYPERCTEAAYKHLMEEECPKTCGLCGGGGIVPSPCVDKAAPGQLSTCPSQVAWCRIPAYEAFMKVQCRKTCGYC